MYIYKITNNLNGKIYIGLSTKNVNEHQNYYGSGKLILQAIDKYGKNNFTKEILVKGITDKKKLAKLEIDFIKKYNSTDRNVGYNISLGGDLNPDMQRIAIYKYSIEGKLVQYYLTIQDAVEESMDYNIYRKAQRDTRPLKGYWYSTEPLTEAEVIQKQNEYLQNKKLQFQKAMATRMSDPKLAQFYKNNMRRVQKPLTNFETTEETKHKISESLTGRHWYHNPSDHSQNGQYHQPPTGWVRGRGKKYNRPSGLTYKNSRKN